MNENNALEWAVDRIEEMALRTLVPAHMENGKSCFNRQIVREVLVTYASKVVQSQKPEEELKQPALEQPEDEGWVVKAVAEECLLTGPEELMAVVAYEKEVGGERKTITHLRSFAREAFSQFAKKHNPIIMTETKLYLRYGRKNEH